MLDKLIISNFKNHADINLPADSQAFILKTCQRVVIVTYKNENIHEYLQTLDDSKTYLGTDAYQFLLQVICGLKSKLVGENEIVGQFKTAYKDYCKGKNIDNNLLIILEKLLKDAKEIRTKYLLGICQKTYASIARKHIVNIHKADTVLVLGSGSLAEDLINQFKKKSQVFISARNIEKVHQLANKHDLQIIPWKNIFLFQNFSHIANTIGADEVILDQKFFDLWSQKHDQKLFIDLSSGCSIRSHFGIDDGLMTLQEIFSEGAIHESRKKEQIKLAQSKMTEIVQKRYIHLAQKLNNQQLYGESNEKQKVI